MESRAYVWLASMLLLVSVAVAGDAWPHAAANMEHTMFTAAPGLPGAELEWTRDGAADFPSVVIDAAGRPYLFVKDGSNYRVVSLNPATGADDVVYAAGLANPGALALGGNMLYVVADGSVMAWNIGSPVLAWSVKPEDILSAPVCDSSGNVYFAGVANVYRYSPAGAQDWAYPLAASTIGAWPATTNGGIFMPVDSKLLGVNLAGGSKRFEVDATSLGYDYFTGPVAGPAPDYILWVGAIYSGQVYRYGGIYSFTGNTDAGYFEFADKSVRLHSITPGNLLIFHGGQRLYVWDYAKASPDVNRSVGFDSSPITCAPGVPACLNTEGAG